jgi:L-ascorbate metabolism protein UlaG (beta-lactamase superfamily)
VIEPALSDDAFLADVDAAGDALWWLGQSGFLLKRTAGSDKSSLASVRVRTERPRFLLVDPYLSDSLTKKYAATDTPHVRMTRRVVAPERLGFVDVVLATHGHTDHLDPETLPHVGGTLVAPAGIAGLAHERSGREPVTLSEGESVEVAGFSVTAVPARHPGPHCVGYVIDGRVYHAGDTEAIEPPARGVEVALVPINGKVDNMDGVEAARLAHAMRAALAVPMHVEMFEFNTASPDAFVAECERLGQPYRVLRAGERLDL